MRKPKLRNTDPLPLISKASQPSKLLTLLVVALVVAVGGYLVVRSSHADTLAGDLNGDGTVNVFDLSILLSDWGTNNATADLNHDGTVNIFDLSTLLTNWGKIATPTPTPASGAWPGQSGNPVGYAVHGPLGTTAWPGGSFTNGTAASPKVYKGYKFQGTQNISGSYITFESCDFVGGAQITGDHLTFTGDRFQSNSVAYFNVNNNATNVNFSYDSFTPLASFYTSPPGEIWPSAGSGQNTTKQTADVNAINGNEGYQFSLLAGGGPITVDHSDFWGFGNAIVFGNTTTQMNVTNNWFHDAADAGPQAYHTDGPGYLNGGAGPSNVLIQGNTIASLGNTNGIAFQAATSGYANMQIIGNFLSGFGYTVAPGFPGNNHFTNSSFKDNVFGTDIEPIWGALYSWTDTGNNIWKCNKYEFRTGTNWTNGNNWHPDSSYDDKYWLPSSGPSTTDYKGNTTCP